MRHGWGLLIAGALLGFASVAAEACDQPMRVDNMQVKVLMATLKDAKAPDLDRGLALETLMCDDRPYIREEAMKQAMGAATSPMLRSMALTALIFNARSLQLELQEGPQLNAGAKDFLRKTGGIVTIELFKSFPAEGCVNTHKTSKTCNRISRIFIRGTSIDLKLNPGSDGTLELKDGGTLIGYYRPDLKSSPIPARIVLF